MAKIFVDQDKCTRCGGCVETCPAHIFFMEGSRIKIHREETCFTCGHCLSVCPEEAVIHEGLDVVNFIPQREALGVLSDDLYHFLRSRRSCRVYEPREVPREMLEKLLDIGRYAPTGTNLQNVEFIVVQHADKIAKLSRMAGAFYGRYVRELEASKEPLPAPLARRMDAMRLYHKFSLEGKDRVFRGGQAAIMAHGPVISPTSGDNCHYALFHMILMAHSMGLGTCLLQTFVLAVDKDPEIRREIGLPDGQKVFGCFGLGFPKYHFRKLPARKGPKVRWI